MGDAPDQTRDSSRFVDTNEDAVVDPATLPGGRDLLAMLDEQEAAYLSNGLSGAFDRFMVMYGRFGGPRYHGWTDYEDPENYKGPMFWSEHDCVYRLALELEKSFPWDVHLELPVARWSFGDYDAECDKREFIDIVVSHLTSFQPDETSQHRFTTHRHELFIEAKHLPRGVKGGKWEYDHIRKLDGIAKDAYRLNEHLQRNHCKMAAVLVVDDDGLFDDHRDEHEWPPAVQLLLASPQELQRRGLAAAP